MADTKARFTAYFSAAEREQIRRQAVQQHTSDNHVLRAIVRQHYGLDVPGDATTESPTAPPNV